MSEEWWIVFGAIAIICFFLPGFFGVILGMCWSYFLIYTIAKGISNIR